MAWGTEGRSKGEASIGSRRPRHQGGAHGGRVPAKIVRAQAKITGLFMLKIDKDQMATLC